MHHLRSAMLLSAVAVTAVLCPWPAAGQMEPPDLLDHLICYRMRDPLSVSAKFDLLAHIQPEFSRLGCKLVFDNDDRGNSQFCVPASKVDVEASQHDPNAAIGVPLFNDYVCYRVECDQAPRPPDKTVVDQFGERHARFGQPVRVCVPALKRPVPCGIMDNMGKQCGGECPSADQTCRADQTTNQCVCAPLACGGSPDAAGMCGGSCPGATDPRVRNDENRCVCEPRGCGLDPATGQCGGLCANAAETCTIDADGVCGCHPRVDECAFDADAGQCNGPCPPGLTCQLRGMECFCQPPPGECGSGPAGQCSGTCPNSGETCGITADGACTCQPLAEACSVDPMTGQCAGPCLDATQVCRPFNNGECRCQDAPNECGRDPGTGQCGGRCRMGLSCEALDSGECGCVPRSDECSMRADGQCGGECAAANEKCLPTDDDACECQPSVNGCGVDPMTGQCGGRCRMGLSCEALDSGDCGCVPRSDECSMRPGGQCGGGCAAANEKCLPT